MKNFLLIPLALFNLLSVAQSNTEKLKKINTAGEADAFIRANPGLCGKILELNSGVDSTEIARKVISARPGELFVVGDYTYKVIGSKASFMLRANYINISGDKFSKFQLDSIRAVMISKYNTGVLFPQLAREYSQDPNATGDLGWAPEEMLLPEFSSAIKAHKKGDMFTIDIPGKNWYYVMLKTFDDREVKIYSVLGIKNNK